MTDDHDRCEWMNVSSGTGSPGLSRTKPESHRTVICVFDVFSETLWKRKHFKQKLTVVAVIVSKQNDA